ncbi:MAG: 4'-phosphopantetheinyl transferase superfamily protein [Micropruina sp.]|uniref:4'-phosphopantetheinyl transferase family protein n=1 Tax=Micropruina sp. TaxID=2737536 RepID=UPI0039E635B5
MATVLLVDITRLTAADVDQLARQASPERRERAARFRFEADRLRCLVAGALLAHALVRTHRLRPDDYTITRNRYGKPLLQDRPGVEFNLSHAGSWVVCATGTDPVGVDVEALANARPHLADGMFAPDERDYVLGGPAAEASLRFTRVWTLKEAYTKYLGRGLSEPLDRFSVLTGDGLVPAGEGVPAPSLHWRTVDDAAGIVAWCGTAAAGWELLSVESAELVAGLG